ncbi:fimbrial protein [Acinetobacter rudis]|uniref:Fimbrial-type adhesion domain-containing protein n=1 Tax=Acinetobacter rudis CIP 110305 TaxID=421052 RepID=S3MQN6_9GAMM|nr:fimbrial protein [Acinetobacter rudis]EPF69932.1 hypothetical protein F945_03495 [Acinetobacter rudis CIP 110305]
MKLALTVLASAAAITLSTQASAAGQVNFTGQIINAACEITVDGKQNGQIDLGKWPTSTFQAVGDKSSPKPFVLKVSDCIEGSYNLHFEGDADLTNPKLLKASEATGVGIAIANMNSMTNLVNINTGATGNPNAEVIVAAGQKDGTLNLQSFYQSTTATVTAGKADATARITLEQK